MQTKSVPLLVAVVGGSGAGKSRLADRLQSMLGKEAARISLDDFYRDRSHLPPARRARINYDHPRAIDWPRLKQVLHQCLGGRAANLPVYDFATHSRTPKTRLMESAPLILLDGLWLLRRRELRGLFELGIFIECPTQTRLARRLSRDLKSRGRSQASVREQFLKTVEPMHRQYVAPQARWAGIRLKSPVSEKQLKNIAGLLEAKLRQRQSAASRT